MELPPSQEIEHCQHFWSPLPASTSHYLLSSPQSNHYSDLIMPVFGLYINGFIQYILFLATLLYIMFLRFIHVNSCNCSSFSLLYNTYNFVCIYHNLFIQSIDGCLDFYHFLTVTNNFVWTCLYLSLSVMLSVEYIPNSKCTVIV